MQDLGTLGAELAYAVSADGSVVVGGLERLRAGYTAFRWTASGGMQDLGTLGGNGAWLMLFPPTAPWWSATLPTPQGVACLSLDGVGWDATARHAGRGSVPDTHAYAVSADGTVMVGSAYNAAGQCIRLPFAGRRRVAMEDLNTTYASLLIYGSHLDEARAISPDGRYIVGYGQNAATGRYEAFLLDTRRRAAAPTPAM
jgi:probable HAF family extracellular repeat protein